MPLSKKSNRERMQKLRRNNVSSVMVSDDVRAIRKAGLDPEDIGNEAGKISCSVYYALMRDRDAIKAHLSWHHESVNHPDVLTRLERLEAKVEEQANMTVILTNRLLGLETDFTLHEPIESYGIIEGVNE